MAIGRPAWLRAYHHTPGRDNGEAAGSLETDLTKSLGLRHCLASLFAVSAFFRAALQHLVRRKFLALDGASVTSFGAGRAYCRRERSVTALAGTGAAFGAVGAQFRALSISRLVQFQTVPHALGTLDEAVRACLSGFVGWTFRAAGRFLLRGNCFPCRQADCGGTGAS